VTKFLSDEGLL
jgi:hypothetical protein